MDENDAYLSNRMEAESEQLKAHNRQLVGVLENVIKTLNHDVQLVYSKGQKVGHPVWLHKPSSMKRDAEFYERALQAPPAKVAQAEAAVLRAAEVFYQDSLLKHLDEADASLTYSYFQRMVRAMQEARRLPMDETWNGYNEAGDSGLIAERLAELKQEAKGDA